MGCVTYKIDCKTDGKTIIFADNYNKKLYKKILKNYEIIILGKCFNQKLTIYQIL